MLVKGELIVASWLSPHHCAYKYVLLNEKTIYEELVEFQPWIAGVVNRWLVIKEEYVTKDSKLTE